MVSPNEVTRFSEVDQAIGLAAGLIARFGGRPDLAAWCWMMATAPVLAALVIEIASSLRGGDVSLVAALIFGEYLAAEVVALMHAGGQYFEGFAETPLN